MLEKRWFLAALTFVAVAVIAAGVRPVFAGTWQIDPVAVHLGPLSIRWYGIIIAASFVPAIMLARHLASDRGLDVEELYNIVLVAVPSGLIGARLGYVIQNFGYYSEHPGEILSIWLGGLSIHGALFVGALALAIYAWTRKLSFWSYADVATPAVLLGQGIGRWGNFFNQELFGYPTGVPWRMFVRPENRPPEYAADAFFHPTFLYESLWNLAGVAVLIAFARRRPIHSGQTMALYLVVYSIGRFLVEFFRIGNPLAGLTLAQWVSLALAVLGALLFTYLGRFGTLEAAPSPAGHAEQGDEL